MENTEQQGPGIENGSEWSNGTVHFDRTGPTKKSGPPRKVDHFFRNLSGWTEPIHSVLDRNFRKFWLNGSRPLTSALQKSRKIFDLLPHGAARTDKLLNQTKLNFFSLERNSFEARYLILESPFLGNI